MSDSLDVIKAYKTIDLDNFEIRGSKSGINNARSTGVLFDNGSYFLYEDGKWVKNSDVIKELFDQGFRFLSSHRRENRSEVEPLMTTNTKNWFDAIIDEDEEIVDPIKKDIKLSLSNNKSVLKQKIK